MNYDSGFIFYLSCICVLMCPKGSAQRSRDVFGVERAYHRPTHLTGEQLDSAARLANDLTVFKRALNAILVPRVVGTDSHKKVQNYIISEFSNLGWHVETDSFTAHTPIGNLPFKNIIATHNPKSKRFLDIACHYDTKYYPGTNDFVGATDSAVPCAMMIHMAYALHESLEKNKNPDLSLQLIFFDGEEAFRTWTKSDSLYGSRHLARKWEGTPYTEGGPGVTQLDRMDMLVLLDLLGAKNPEFYSFFPQTQEFYKMFVTAETKLNQRNLLRNYNRRYFHRKSTDHDVQDDHLPFIERDVPAVHLITIPFPPVWHTPADNSKIIDLPTTQNLMKIMMVFIAEYMNLTV